MNVILITHIFSTLFMCGLVWFVQIVHYPLFKGVPLEDFPAYQKRNFVTGFVTVPVMITELFSGLWILCNDYSNLFLINMILLAVIWGSTFVFQVPTHLALVKIPSQELFNKLIHTNWIRTICWSLRSSLLGYLLLTS